MVLGFPMLEPVCWPCFAGSGGFAFRNHCRRGRQFGWSLYWSYFQMHQNLFVHFSLFVQSSAVLSTLSLILFFCSSATGLWQGLLCSCRRLLDIIWLERAIGFVLIQPSFGMLNFWSVAGFVSLPCWKGCLDL
ncbi:uncharacterized protein A4U43_C08F25320 [Asparagus officinalis]|nr:uncharacterized protein A4U43_C08F25320 [Asparagus officinalis]